LVFAPELLCGPFFILSLCLSVCLSLMCWFHFLLMYPQKWDDWIIWQFYV
jgi:hypothetical protein